MKTPRRKPPWFTPGARDALLRMVSNPNDHTTVTKTNRAWADAMLVSLWCEGFKIVPISASEAAPTKTLRNMMNSGQRR